MRNFFIVLLAAGWWMLGVSVCPAFLEDDPRADNAALDYLKAASLISDAVSPEELELHRFIREDLPGLPAQIFMLQQDEARWLLGEQPVVRELAQARRRSVCAFPIRSSGNPFLELMHLPILRELTQRALATAKAYEYAENMEGAAEIYVSLLGLVKHLDDDRNLRSALAGMDILQKIATDMEGFLSREPPEEATSVLARFFLTVPRPLFHIGDTLRDEGRRFRSWLLTGGGSPEQRLRLLYGNSSSRLAVDQLVTLPEAKKAERFRNWVMDYDIRMIRLGDAVDKPYKDAVGLVRDMDAGRAVLADAAEFPKGGNPLVPLLVPTMARILDRAMLAEGQFNMLHILSLGAGYRARLGRWPVNQDEIVEWVSQTVPQDPFTGKPFHYKLIKIRPRIVTRVPKWMAAEEKLLYFLDVTRRRLQDSEAYQAAAAAIQDAAKPVTDQVPRE